MIPILRFVVRTPLALAIAVLLCSAAARAETVARGGACAATAQRELCASGACTDESGKARTRFSPEDVASNDADDRVTDGPPDAADFSGPGTCADPSVGCGNPRSVRVVASSPTSQPTPASPTAVPPAAPITPAPPTAPIPSSPPGGGIVSPPTPPTPLPIPPAPVVAPPPAPPTPPTPPPAPPAPPPPAPPAPPAPPPAPPPPIVVEPPPTPVLPPGVPQP